MDQAPKKTASDDRGPRLDKWFDKSSQPIQPPKPHKTMTAEEYAAMKIEGWHEVCRNVDGFGGVGIRFISK
jgi:hypothetical protein